MMHMQHALPRRPKPRQHPGRQAPMSARRVLGIGAEDPIDLLAHEIAEHTDENHTAAQQGSQGVEPTPRIEAVDRIRVLRRSAGRHRPARCASPRAVRRSRSASASGNGSPGTVPPLAGLAVWIVTLARPRRRSTGPEPMSAYCSRP